MYNTRPTIYYERLKVPKNGKNCNISKIIIIIISNNNDGDDDDINTTNNNVRIYESVKCIVMNFLFSNCLFLII